MTLRALMPTDAWVRWLLVPAVAFSALASNTSYLADFWHHLARGRAIVERGELLNHDIFTCTVAGQPFQDVNWLSQVIYFGLYEQGGLALVRVVNAALVALTLVWLVALCRRASGSLVVAAGAGIGVFLGLWDVLTIRPQTHSLLLFVAMTDVLERSERRAWLLCIPPLLLALWANLHGAFPAGLMLLGCWWLVAGADAVRRHERMAWRRWLHLSVCLAAGTLATLLNPYGWDIYRYVGQTSNLAAVRGIDEWLPPGLDSRIGWAFYASLPIVFGLLVLAWRTPCTPAPSPSRVEGGRATLARDVLLIVCSLPLAATSLRMVAWWLLVIAPIVSHRISKLWPSLRAALEHRPNRGAILSVFALLALATLSLPGLLRFNPLLHLRPTDPTTANLQAAYALLARELDQGRLFTRFEWGEYLSWAGHPRLKVFMDGRIEIYPDDVWQAYAAVTCGDPSWHSILEFYQINALLLDADYHRRTGLLARVEASPQWQQHTQIGNAIVFVRSSSVARQ